MFLVVGISDVVTGVDAHERVPVGVF